VIGEKLSGGWVFTAIAEDGSMAIATISADSKMPIEPGRSNRPETALEGAGFAWRVT